MKSALMLGLATVVIGATAHAGTFTSGEWKPRSVDNQTQLEETVKGLNKPMLKKVIAFTPEGKAVICIQTAKKKLTNCSPLWTQ